MTIPPYGLPPLLFLQENLDHPSSMIFQKSPPPISMRGVHTMPEHTQFESTLSFYLSSKYICTQAITDRLKIKEYVILLAKGIKTK